MSSIREISSLLVIVLLSSCMKDATIQYNSITMGNFVEGRFISDNGHTFNITESTVDLSDTLKRAIVSCDILAQKGAEEYDIRLTGVTPVFTKAPVDSTAVTDSAVFVENPLNIAEMWIAGGYINMYLLIPAKSGSEHVHLINLVRDDAVESDGTYDFTLKHNAYGETVTSPDSDFVLGAVHASFPVSDILKGDSAVVSIHWTSQEFDAAGWSTETKRNTLRYEWTRGGYEHKF